MRIGSGCSHVASAAFRNIFPVHAQFLLGVDHASAKGSELFQRLLIAAEIICFKRTVAFFKYEMKIGDVDRLGISSVREGFAKLIESVLLLRRQRNNHVMARRRNESQLKRLFFYRPVCRDHPEADILSARASYS